ncbi:UDP-N-acetylmuramyl tripeptide synthase (plasmid) [Legionella adelaidensis]|uniref:UDP-N-acetylmuramyl tripeptide synthase n=1 Tax=Legionella adelaidensis TaxID=45056 RepID=A0A0W0R0D0_9GAMM|nr:hypothetical protein [Legionella adelaidensis]KTC64493.1 UDP-N-acetylmuramyl tripeptide synthase [Legionella adelaidensis]VEH85861.1 UDP-N-acetylmuramyl tripeptide synthase [Legionella adelaidensis]
MAKNSDHFLNAAQRYCLPVNLLPEMEAFEVKLGKKNYFFRGACTPLNSFISVEISSNKFSMNALLYRAGLPVPKATAIHFEDYQEGLLDDLIADLKFPVVAKPTAGRLGRDVVCNIPDKDHLKKHVDLFFKNCMDKYNLNVLSVEEFHGGLNSYRVLVFKKKVLGVVLRYPAHVVGDDEHTLNQLIEITNQRRKSTNEVLAPIVHDDEMDYCLQDLGVTLDYIPKKGERVFLGYTSNASRGGTFVSLGKKICKQNKKLLIKAAQAINLDLVGFDILCKDITQPMEDTGGVIIECNFCPSVRIHEEAEKNPIAVCRPIIRSLIYRHPLSYLKALLQSRKSRAYIRTILIVIFFGGGFTFLFH